MKYYRMKIQCVQDEGVHSSSHHMTTFVWDLNVPTWFPKFPMDFNENLSLKIFILDS